MNLHLVVFLALLLTLPACQSRSPVSPPLLASISGSDFAPAELPELIERWKLTQTMQPSETEVKALTHRVSRALLNWEVLSREAKAKGQGVDGPALIQSFIASLAPGTTLESYLQSTGETESFLRKRLETRAYLAKLTPSPDRPPGEAEARKYYERHRDQFQSRPQVLLRRQLWRVPANAKPPGIEFIRKRIEAELGSKRPINPLNPELPLKKSLFRPSETHAWHSQKELPAAVAKWVSNAKRNETSTLIRTPEGFERVTLLGRRDGRNQSFASVKQRLTASLRANLVRNREQETLQALLKKYQVKVFF